MGFPSLTLCLAFTAQITINLIMDESQGARTVKTTGRLSENPAADILRTSKSCQGAPRGTRGSASRASHAAALTVIIVGGHGTTLSSGCIVPPASGVSWLTMCCVGHAAVLTVGSFYSWLYLFYAK